MHLEHRRKERAVVEPGKPLGLVDEFPRPRGGFGCDRAGEIAPGEGSFAGDAISGAYHSRSLISILFKQSLIIVKTL